MKNVFTLRSDYDDLPVSVLAVLPEEAPSAVLQIAHGMRGHKERFLPFMEFMAERGVACFANDHRGHGASVLSPEDLGYLYKGGAKALVSDMKQLSDYISASCPSVPFFLLGHSMGSLAARVYMKIYDVPLAGAVICGSPSRNPLCGVGMMLTGVMSLWNEGRYRPSFMQKMTSYMYNRNFRNEGRDAWTCSDPQVRKAFAEDRLSCYDFTANACHALMSMMNDAYSESGWRVERPSLPVLFLSGGDDPCMRGEKHFHESAYLMHKVGYRDVSSVLYPGMRHEILNEAGKEAVWNDIFEFVSNVSG